MSDDFTTKAQKLVDRAMWQYCIKAALEMLAVVGVVVIIGILAWGKSCK